MDIDSVRDRKEAEASYFLRRCSPDGVPCVVQEVQWIPALFIFEITFFDYTVLNLTPNNLGGLVGDSEEVLFKIEQVADQIWTTYVQPQKGTSMLPISNTVH